MNKEPNKERVELLLPFIDTVQQKYREMNKAKRSHEIAEAAFRMAVGQDHEFSISSCRVNKIGGCIYPMQFSRGVGLRNCILCGVDDFDF